MENNEEIKNDDIAAKREARRQKILENSKSRLSRITGREHTDEDDVGSNEKNPGNQPTEQIIYPDPEIERDVYIPQMATIPSEFFGDFNGINPLDDQQPFIQMLNNLRQQQSTGQGSANANSFAAFAQFGSFDGSAGSNPFANINANESPKVPETRLQKFLNTKIHIALLAVITFFSFHWNIFLILLVWEITEIFILKQHETNSNGFINALFMIAGMSPNKFNIVLKWIQLLNKVLCDVALFMFFFVLSHLCRVYWNGLSLHPIIESNAQSHTNLHTSNARMEDDVFEDFDL